MDNKDWYQCGARIGELVQSAIDSQNFSSLSRAIQETLNQTMERAAGSLRGEGMNGEPGRQNEGVEYRMRGGTAYERARERAKAEPYGLFRSASSFGRKKNTKGIASMAVGYAMAALTGIGFISIGMLTALTGFVGFRFLSVFLLIMTFIFMWMGSRGSSDRRRIRRAERYIQIMNGRNVVQLDEIAAATGRSVDYVRKDLTSMIREGMFEGNIMMDDQGTCIMAGPETYAQYRSTMRAYEEKKQEEKRSAQRRRDAEKHMEEYPEETREILQEGRDFISHIHECNERVPDEEFSEKLSLMEKTVTRIFEQVAKDPESAPDLHKLMTYYLPITRKLIDAYEDLYRQGSGRNVVKTKKEIVESLDTVNTAFEVLLDSFFEDTAWDISTDITTLKTMMARDGLTGSDFKKRREEERAETEKTAAQNAPSAAGSVKNAGGIELTFGSGAAAAAPDSDKEKM